MKNIAILSSAQEVGTYLADLRRRGIRTLALDLEADQGMYRYRYSISIFQCFDGENHTIIDVLALRGLDELRELLEAPDIVKIMFSSKNDLFITQNVLDCTISPIRDIATAQKILGLKVNLSDRIGIDKALKDTFQRANWLKRPLSKELLQYAAGDVEPLIDMEAELCGLMAEKRVADRYRDACAALSRANYRMDQYLRYREKFPGYRRLSPGKKDLARRVWIFRELVGEHFDRPVGYILSTKALPAIIDGFADPGPERRSLALAEHLATELDRGRKAGRRIDLKLVAAKLAAAERAAAERNAE
jgi:ribonuclease D